MGEFLTETKRGPAETPARTATPAYAEETACADEAAGAGGLAGARAPVRVVPPAGVVRPAGPAGDRGRERRGVLEPKGGGEPVRAGSPGGDRATVGPAGGRNPLDGREAAGILEQARVSVDPELRRAVETLPLSMRRVARYHFGWEDAHGTPAAGNAGKAIRPALVLAAVSALGGHESTAVRAAAAVELVHNFTLLHDDVMDRDTTRRHRATAWTVFGVPDAILAGDAMQALAQQLLAEDPHPASAAASARLASCVIELCAGQHTDTEMEGRRPEEVTLDEVLAMAEAKTGALLGCACAVGALYAGAGEEDVEALDAFGREAGLAFQLIDDVIGIWGDPSRTGKPAGADLMVRKKSLPVVAALASGTPEATELAELYGLPYEEGDLERTARVVERAGGRDWAQVQAADRMARAMQELSRAVPDPESAGGLLALAEFVTRRSS
ncbi:MULTISPECIES: family 2 encapsulin nanocompartment cargo protein polyprenyl transferase [Streptomyces]|uniref:family 2 encapsulin nanocompartment cargo protein polyprenyl transferase n=1 Tax=Streptomyces TaxID=1883 RepID=UPI000BDA07D6|nr:MULTISPECIES: family 2 encapsulin nanocompartment cargo protein polyprenyl transferase [Streptomyces]MDX2549236.1 family 2 encapsulin nanocompartment cargo protein polyprenyl transferase [Streptomyces stelliscabiei]MDX2611259.1 family 2 encapsulin nanocompartment cargo protein polyprenyl transferase [Streptomyces stelliscabiei]MDX2634646.1 family 2 encapsulin nanocompartment cargo protein polyprenyl transferase [Streptomyces stelliscabiei]MDX2659592.1 family 2 encapsulin nanocompartment carg